MQLSAFLQHGAPWTAPFTLDELQAALKLSAHCKKTGSDELPYEFFSQFWEVLGPELLAVLQVAFQAQHRLCLAQPP